jgi:hypothetical protein
MKKLKISVLIFILAVIFSCQKNGTDLTSSSLYQPSNSDVTANATLTELQQGRTLYTQYCGSCHGLYSPDQFSTNQWKNVMSDMARKTGMNSNEVLLVTKYVCKGKQ